MYRSDNFIHMVTVLIVWSVTRRYSMFFAQYSNEKITVYIFNNNNKEKAHLQIMV
jgi:hypothetical protein